MITTKIKAISFFILIISLNSVYSQTNSLPVNGSVGIETTPSPSNSLHILVTNDSTIHPILVEKQMEINHSNYKLLQLDNSGLLYVREVKINLQSWPDFVFHKEYSLMPLNEVETFISENGHLPNIPKAEIIEKDGLSLGEMNKLLMQKVEELTLYLIQQQKVIDAQQKRIEALENKK